MRPLTQSQRHLLRRIASGESVPLASARWAQRLGLITRDSAAPTSQRTAFGESVGPRLYQFRLTAEGQVALAKEK